MKKGWVWICFIVCFAETDALVLENPSDYVLQTYAQ